MTIISTIMSYIRALKDTDISKIFIVISLVLCSFYILLYAGLYIYMAHGGAIASGKNKFVSDLQWAMVNSRIGENVIFSPASIRACTVLAYLGAEGKTAEEIKTGVGLRAGANKEEIAAEHGAFIRDTFKSANGVELNMANGVFFSDQLSLSPKFPELVVKQMQSEAKSINFADSTNAVAEINRWVEDHTKSKIRNLLQPGSTNQDTSALLVNAIYLKGQWAHRFSEELTEKRKFHLSASEEVMVDMMYDINHGYGYADLKDLNATAVSLPYKDSDISMLVILPNKVDGLHELEKKLRNADLTSILKELKVHSVDVVLPKFKIEFDVDLKEPLKELGISTVFSDDSDLSSLFDTRVPQKISKAKHKAFFEVNEVGTEAAAATYYEKVAASIEWDDKKSFRADHPFFFAVLNKDTVFYAGHVTKL